MSRGLYRTPAPTPGRVSSRLNPGAAEKEVGRGGTTTAAAVSKRAEAGTRAGLCPKARVCGGAAPQAPRGRPGAWGAVLGWGGGGAEARSAAYGAGRRQRGGRRGGQARPSSWAAQLTSAPGLRSQSGQDPSQLGRGDPHTLQPLRHLRGGCYSCCDSATAARSQETTTDGRRGALTHSHPFPRPLLSPSQNDGGRTGSKSIQLVQLGPFRP